MIRFGPGGTAGLGYADAFSECSKLGLTALEVEFTYGVRMSNSEAKSLGELAKKRNISLSIHAPYYINLASEEKEKVSASKKRILDSCERANQMGAKYVVFHAGFYQKKSKEETYQIIKKEIIDLLETIKKNKWDVELAIETTGKETQFGDLDELLSLRKETGSFICVDFAHLLARHQKIDYNEIFDKLKEISHIHAHFSGIEYTQKGERNHILTDEKVIIPLMQHILKRKIDITIINESPDPIGDAKKMLEVTKKLET